MIETTVAMAAMAGLFVVFGAFRIADRGHGCDACGTVGGGCGGCDLAEAGCAVVGEAGCVVDGIDGRSGGAAGNHSKGSTS
jgi:hypothetical protein